MKSHLTNRELARYIAGAVNEKHHKRIADHLTECNSCRFRHKKMLAAIAPRYAALRPSEAARVRVMRSRDRLAGEEASRGPQGIRSLLSHHPRALAAGSLALIAAAAVAAALLFRPPAPEEAIHLATVMADTGVTINDKPAHAGVRLYGESLISLPDKTMARLEYGRHFSITLIGPAMLTVDRLALTGSTDTVRLECTLSKGILVSSSEGPGAGFTYAYNTPGARVEPTGTKFLLQSAGGKTLVLMKSGSVSVKPAGSPDHVSVKPGNRCMVSEKTVISKADPGEMRIFDSMEQLRDGAFERQLLKPDPPEKDDVIKQTNNNGHPGVSGQDRTREQEQSHRREKIDGPVRPGMHEQDRISKNKKLFKETRKAIRQKRRAAR